MLSRQVVRCRGLVSMLSQMEFKGGRGEGERESREMRSNVVHGREMNSVDHLASDSQKVPRNPAVLGSGESLPFPHHSALDANGVSDLLVLGAHHSPVVPYPRVHLYSESFH